MNALKCFVIMPFGDDFDPVFTTVREATADAVPGERIGSYWLKDIQSAGRITDDIVRALQEADLCIADVTGANPNVMWETGYAMALGKPTILIGREVEELPFDLKVHRVLPYAPGALESFGQRLAESLRQTLARYELKPQQRHPQAQTETLSIAATGSSRADPARTRRRVETVLRPYLGLGATWYTGSNGLGDEAVLEFLVSHGERAIAVGYNRLDMSRHVRERVESGHIGFLDGSVEPVPKGMTGPSERDAFLHAKADLVIVFWDGESQGTRRLIEYFQSYGKNLLIGFI